MILNNHSGILFHFCSNWNIQMLTLEESIQYISNLDQSKWIDKTEAALIDELVNHECYLANIDNQIRRIVNVGFCNIYYADLKIMEVDQVYHHTGSRKNRNQPVAGKLRYSKDPLTEMVREIREELGLLDSSISIRPELNDTRQILADHSPTYYGLPAVWNEFWYSWELPESIYNPDGYVEVDHLKTTTFKWVTR